MAKYIQIVGTPEGSTQFASMAPNFPVKAGAVSSILNGYLVIQDGSNAGYFAAAPDTTDTDSFIFGVANAPSTDTVAADGVVNVYRGTRILARMFAKTAGSLVSTMVGSKFILDVTSGNYTFDQGTTTKGFIHLLEILDAVTGECLVEIYTS